MKLIELDDEDGGEQVPEWLCSGDGPDSDDGFAETEDDDSEFPTLLCADEEDRPLSELIKAASTIGQLSTVHQHNQWEVSSVAATSNLAAMMIQRKKAVRPWEGQGVKVIGGGRLVEYLDGEAIPEAEDPIGIYRWW
jgi:hypothetical protein